MSEKRSGWNLEVDHEARMGHNPGCFTSFGHFGYEVPFAGFALGQKHELS